MTAPAAVSVPTALIFDPMLSAGALRAYAQLARYGQLLGSLTFALTGSQLGVLTCGGPARAHRRVRELEERALVTVCRQPGQANVYTVRDPERFYDERGA